MKNATNIPARESLQQVEAQTTGAQEREQGVDAGRVR